MRFHSIVFVSVTRAPSGPSGCRDKNCTAVEGSWLGDPRPKGTNTIDCIAILNIVNPLIPGPGSGKALEQRAGHFLTAETTEMEVEDLGGKGRKVSTNVRYIQ